jgi:hypothetical protein
MTKIKVEVSAEVDQLNAIRSKLPILKGLSDALVSQVPIFGTAIISTLDARASELAEKNTKLLAENLKKEMDRLDEEKVDMDFFQTDEFVSLLCEVVVRNAYAYEQEKIKLYARLIANSTAYGKSEMPYKEGFIRIIDEFSVDHIRLLSLINTQSETFNKTQEGSQNLARSLDGKVYERIFPRATEVLGITESRTLAYCDQMVRFGLLRAVAMYDGESGFYELTGYGREFVDFLKEHE